MMMIRIAALLALPLVGAFAPSPSFTRHVTILQIGQDPNVVFGTFMFSTFVSTFTPHHQHCPWRRVAHGAF